MSDKKTPEIRFDGFTDDWEQREVGEVAEKIVEKNINLEYTETFTNSAEFGIVSQRDFFDHDISNVDNINTYYVVKNEDFIYNPRISTFAPVGPINRNKLGRNGVMSPLYTVFRPKNLDNSFLEQFFKSNGWHSFMLLNGDTGARSDRLAIKDNMFFQMPIPHPQIEEQTKIGEFFKNLNNLITCHQRKYDQLQIVKKSMLEKMFPQSGAKVPEIRFDGFTDDWEQRELGKCLLDIADGPFGSNLKSIHYTEMREARIIQLSNIGEDGWLDNNMRYTTFEHSRKISRCIVEPNDLVMAKMMPAGRTIICPNNEKMYVLSSDAIKLKLNNAILFPGYIITATKSSNFLAQVDNDAQGSTRTRTSISKVKKMIIQVPGINEQIKIGEFFATLNNLITTHQRELEKLQNIKKSMLEKMFV